jgi:hypothetical protein
VLKNKKDIETAASRRPLFHQRNTLPTHQNTIKTQSVINGHEPTARQNLTKSIKTKTLQNPVTTTGFLHILDM